MSDKPIGSLFPLGGPVPPELIIGRRGVIDEVAGRMREGLSTMVVGPRRIGKTTVCAAVCQQMKDSELLAVEVDVPERTDSRALLQLIVDACSRISLEARGRTAFRVVRPAVEKLLGDQGIPLDLDLFDGGDEELPIRTVLGLPAEIARREKRKCLLFLDELQRVVDYSDSATVLADLVDLYAGSSDAVVLVDGSDERTLDGMFGPPTHFGKLVDRLTLADSIPLESWRGALTERFADAGLLLPDSARGRILAWGGGRPYPTMAAARYTALSTRKTSSDTVTDFEVQMGLDEAERHLSDDGA